MSDAPKEISIPVWWSHGGVMTRRDCLPLDHPEHTYNYIERELGLNPEDYGMEKPKVTQCPHCGWAFLERHTMKKKTKKAETCLDCSDHKTIGDPDPGDWFRDGDVALVCKKCKNPDMDKNAKYVADRQNRRVVQGGIGPWDWDDIEIPKWCPKKKGKK